jgi:dTDP-glucose pyrophosphorylase
VESDPIKHGKRIRTAVVLAALRPFAPVSGRPVVHWSLQYLVEQEFERVIIGMSRGETRLPRFLNQVFGSQLDLVFVELDEDRGPGFTLLKCLELLNGSESSLVVLGDTLFEFPDSVPNEIKSSFVLTSPVPDAHRWCLADVDDDHAVRNLADKPLENPGEWPALIGVYYFDEVGTAVNSLQTRLATGAGALEMRDALEPYVLDGRLDGYTTGVWFDCGNPDLLTSSRRRLLQSREFNEVQVDDLLGTLTKRSRHRAKLLGEINYYRQLPNDVVAFFPRLVDHSLAPEDTFMTLEYYGCGTLSEFWVFEQHSNFQWSRIFQSLSRIISHLGRYTVDISETASFNFYWTKTLERIAAFEQQDPFFRKLVTATELRLNGETLRGWPTIIRDLEERLRALCSLTTGQLIHGDLCFPNILFDQSSHLFKLIDPRGSFGETGIFGDPRYDVAKLLHSINGGYDLLIHEMFSLRRDGEDVSLRQFFPENRAGVLEEFEAVFGERFDLAEVRLLEGLLFLSMCALHRENPQRQTAMFMIGLRLTNEVLGI